MMTEAERVNTDRPTLCAYLRWKGMYIWAERDASVPPTSDGFFWCQHTQNCLGPDGTIAEPTTCDSLARACHRLEAE